MEESTFNLPFDVYQNIIKMMTFPRYRGLTIVPEDIIDMPTFIRKMSLNHYVVIRATGNTLNIVLLDDSPTNKIPHDSKKITTILERVSNADEIIVVSKDKISSAIQNKIEDIDVIHGDINLYTYDPFKVEIPLAAGIPHERIQPGAEYDALMSDLHLSRPDALAKILSTDPQVIWIGAKPSRGSVHGDIVRITRISSDRGQNIYYRLVVKE